MRFRRVLETGCDAAQYATLLLGQAHSARHKGHPIYATSVADKATLEERITMILTPLPSILSIPSKKGSSGRKPQAFTLCCLVLLGLMLGSAGRLSAQQKDAVHTLEIREQIPVTSTTQPPAKPSENIEVTTTFGPEQYIYTFDGAEVNEADLEKVLAEAAGKNSTLKLAVNQPIAAQRIARIVNLATDAGFSRLDFSAASAPEDPAAALAKKLDDIVIPQVEFNDTTLSAALEFLVKRSSDLDVNEKDPSKKGINIVLNAAGAEPTRITLKLSNVPLSEALRYTANLAQLEYTVEPHNILIVPISKGHDQAANKLKEIRLPSVEFAQTPYRDAFAFLSAKSVEFDRSETDLEKKGVSIAVIRKDQTATGDSDADGLPLVTMKFKNATLGEMIRAIAQLADDEVSTEDNTVIVHPKR